MNFSAADVSSSFRKHRTRWIVGTALVLGTATPSFAIFGLGDIVFDPTSYVNMISQLSELANLYEQAQKQYATTVQQYNTTVANVKHFSLKTDWKTALLQLKSVKVGNTYGETEGLTAALNSDSVAAANSAWSHLNVALAGGASGVLQTEAVGASHRLSELAMIEASDAASPDCLNAVGSYRAARATNANAQQSLQNQQLDASDDTNSEVQQLNLLNAAQVQQMNDQQAQGALHTCIATQLAIQNLQQRNAASHDLNTAAYIRQQNLTAPKHPENQGDTWNNFLP